MANLGATVIRRVSPAILISALLLTACQSIAGGEWQVRNFDAKKLSVVGASLVDQVLVDQLVEDYKKLPADSGYPALTLSRVLEDGENGGRRYFVFDLQYVDDISVVYVLDSRNVILEKFLASPWKTNGTEAIKPIP